MECRTDRIPRSAALGDLLRGHLVQSVHAPKIFNEAELDNLAKGFGGTYLCDRLSHRWLGTEEKGSCGWLPGVVVRGPRFVPPVLELRSDERGEEMICAGTDLR